MKTLILIDIQNDFLPSGALPVPNGDEIIPVVNRLLPAFDLVLGTKDWHPANHVSFASNHPGRQVGDIISCGGAQQMLWPDHCVQETPGADFPGELDSSLIQHVVQKGVHTDVDSYSGFFDNQGESSTGLEKDLKSRDIEEIFVAGLATDYCVKFTVLDALRLGFSVRVVRDACRGVNVQPGDVDSAWREMADSGALLITTSEVLESNQ